MYFYMFDWQMSWPFTVEQSTASPAATQDISSKILYFVYHSIKLNQNNVIGTQLTIVQHNMADPIALTWLCSQSKNPAT